MACSLNGLTVGDSVSVNMLDSPTRSESFLSPNYHYRFLLCLHLLLECLSITCDYIISLYIFLLYS